MILYFSCTFSYSQRKNTVTYFCLRTLVTVNLRCLFYLGGILLFHSFVHSCAWFITFISNQSSKGLESNPWGFSTPGNCFICMLISSPICSQFFTRSWKLQNETLFESPTSPTLLSYSPVPENVKYQGKNALGEVKCMKRKSNQKILALSQVYVEGNR